MKNLFLIQLFLIACFLTNCTINTKSDLEHNLDLSSVKTINCNDYLKQIIDKSFDSTINDDIIDTIIVTKLETSKSSLLGFIRHIVFSEEYIYLSDFYGSVIIFDKNGNYINNLIKGNGPGELFDKDIQITYNSALNSFYVVQRGIVNKFSPDGNFIESFKINYLFDDLLPYKNKFCIYQSEGCNMSRIPYVILADSTFEVESVTTLLPRYYELSSLYPISQSSNGDIYITWPTDNNIYCFKDDSLRLEYQFDLSDYQFEFDNDIDPQDIMFNCNKNKFTNLGDFFVTSNYQHFKLSTKHNTYFFYYNTTTHKCRFGNVINSLLSPVICTYNDYFVSILECQYINFPKNFFDDKHYISQESIEKIENSSIEDNPLIIFYKLKDIPEDYE